MEALNNIQRNYAAIGQVCANWSDLEYWCQHVSEVVSPLLSIDFERSETRLVLTVALAHMDIRNKIATAKVLVDQAGLSRDLKRETTAVLNRIDNEHRQERNRFIHDEWIVGAEGASRTTLRPKIVKPQSHKSELLLAEVRRFSTTELEQFAQTLHNTTYELLSLIARIEGEFEKVAPALRSARKAHEEKSS